MSEHILTQHQIAIHRVKPPFCSLVSVSLFFSLFTFSISVHLLYGVSTITCFSSVN